MGVEINGKRFKGYVKDAVLLTASRHQRLWKCVSAICPSNNNYNEFAHWAVEFRSSLPKIYEIWGANGEAYFMKQNDKPIQA